MVINLVLIFISIVLGVLGQIAMKYGSVQVGTINFSQPFTFVISALTNFYTLLGLGLYFISSVFWIIVLSRVELSFAYPLISLGFILVLIVSALLFHEKVLTIHYAGIVLIIAGVVLITRGR